MKTTILIVDDREMLLYIARSQLASKGFNVLMAHNEQEAMKIIGETAVDVIVMDINLGMKGGEGLTILRRVRDLDKDMPVIMLSSDTTMKQQCYDLGANYFLTKPVNYENLHRQIDRVQDDRTILVADDNERTRMILTQVLTVKGYHVIEAPHGEKVLSWLRQHTPRVILLDIEMPVMDGIATMREICDQGYSVPVLVLSGTAEESKVEEIRRLGIRGFIRKPVNFAELCRLISEVSAPVRSDTSNEVEVIVEPQ